MIIKAHYNGQIYKIELQQAQNLYKALTDRGINVSAPCGGTGKCGKCKVRFLSSDYKVTADARGEIVACRHTVKGNLEIEVYAFEGDGVTHFCETQFDTADCDGFSAALDIGTTTLAAYLADGISGQVIKTYSSLNPQYAYGADVISRIQYCSDNGTQKLQREILNAAGRFLSQFNTQIQGKIKNYFIAGNTAMLHIFAGVDPTPLGIVPFRPMFTDTQTLKGADLGLACENVILLPSASAYIGSDITAGIIATDLNRKDESGLLIDFGTNGEMVLYAHNKLYSASTAAGPAFEGANISCGMGGVEGAISQVRYKDGELDFTVIGGGMPKGICGAGLVDLAAILAELGVIDESGLLCAAGEFFGRVTDKGFHISHDLYLTQKDVREIQLAKSAIFSGINILLKQAGITPEEIETVYVAGGFGFYMDIGNAVRLKILPRQLAEKVRQVGNTSGKGAVQCALSLEALNRCERAAKQIINIDLAANIEFMDEFVDNMSF